MERCVALAFCMVGTPAPLTCVELVRDPPPRTILAAKTCGEGPVWQTWGPNPLIARILPERAAIAYALGVRFGFAEVVSEHESHVAAAAFDGSGKP